MTLDHPSWIPIACLTIALAACQQDGLPVPAPWSAPPDASTPPPDLAHHCRGPVALAEPQVIPAGGRAQQTLIANLDGVPGNDLAISLVDAPYFRPLPGRGSGLGAPVDSADVGPIAGLAAVDFDGDGAIDLVGNATRFNALVFVLNLGDGRFGSAAGLTPKGEATDLQAADIDGDGRSDLAGVDFVKGVVHVFMSQRPMGFGRLAFEERLVSPGVGMSPSALGLADVTGDGHPDLVVADSRQKLLTVMPYDVASMFQPVRSSPAGTKAGSVAIGDVDDDGRPDVILGSNVGGAMLLVDQGAGQPTSPVPLPAPANVGRIALADIDGDGHADLVFVNEAHNAVSVIFNEGGGHFGEAREYPANQSPLGFAVGDLDGDGAPDVSVANPGQMQVSVLYNHCR